MMKISQRKIITVKQAYKNTPSSKYKKLLDFRNTHKIKVLERAGRRIEYLITKNGKKTILIFHGAFGSAETPWSEIERIENDYQIISPTIKGFTSLKEISDAVNMILDYENIEKVIIRGGSFGAYIAQAYFWRNYKKVDGLILINGIPPQETYSKKDWLFAKLFSTILKLLPMPLLKTIMLREINSLTKIKRDLTEKQMREIRFLKDQVVERLRKIQKHVILDSLNLVVEFDLNEKYSPYDLKTWNGKVLLITDNIDSSYKNFNKLISLYPNSEKHIFKNSGHLLQLIHKNEFEEIIDKFLRSN